MFSNQGLFASTPCPDPACKREGCPFSHALSTRPVDVANLLGFKPTTVRTPTLKSGASTDKASSLEVTSSRKREGDVLDGGSSKTSRPNCGPSTTSALAGSTSRSRATTNEGGSSISSLKAQTRAAAPPSVSTQKSLKRPTTMSNAVASSPKVAASAADRPKSSFLQRPPPAPGTSRPPTTKSSSGLMAVPETVVGRTKSAASTTRTPPAAIPSSSSSHFISTTARSSGPQSAASRTQSVTRPSNQPPPAKTSRSQPPAPRLNFLPSQTVVPLKTRQRGLDLLFKEFLSLYGSLGESVGWEEVGKMAGDDALGQEAECYAKGGKTGFNNAVTNTATAIRKRDPPTSTSHPSVGLQATHLKALEDLSSSFASRLSPPVIQSLLASKEVLETYGYMMTVPPVEGGTRPTAEGTLGVCERCNTEFVVGEIGEGAACWYHWGRARYGKEQGIRTQLATCCGLPWTSQGCTTSTSHVFKETDPAALHDRCAFISSDQLPAPAEGSTLDVVGLDCEMLYTTGGFTLARLTVVDEDGGMLLDEFVRPDPARILDHNSRFSGIKPGQAEDAAMDLAAVRTSLGTFVGPDTAIVGHGLENDLMALRLVHFNVIDTAILFPHPSGPPYRLALRDLMMKHLSKVIQNQASTGEGHSSLEDAAGSMELVRQRAKEMRERQGKL